MRKLLLILSLMSVAVASHSQKIRIVENSIVAKVVAKIKGEQPYAITFGKTILVSCKKEDFFAQKWWVKHELAHVRQYEQLGVRRFLALYVYYALFRHKTGNPFEIEAEAAENKGESSLALKSKE